MSTEKYDRDGYSDIPSSTLLEDLEKAAKEIELVGRTIHGMVGGTPDQYNAFAARLRSHAARLREEWNRWEGDMDGAGGVVARINGGPLGKDPR